MRAISKRLLIHNCTVNKPSTTDSWGNVTIIIATSLTKIRIDPSSSIKKDKQNNDIQLNSILFYDCKNSLPSSFTFEYEQKVVFNNKEYTVASIDYLYDRTKLHHLEVGLV